MLRMDYAEQCAVADAARARQAANAATSVPSNDGPLVRIGGRGDWVTGWAVVSNGVTFGRFYGAGSKRLALAMAKDRGL